MEFSPSVKILDQSLISPPPLAAGDSRPSLPLNFFDMLWLNYSPVERLFFYQFSSSSSHFLNSHLPILKSSLAATLSTFYPLAATIRRRQSDFRFEIAPADTDFVPLTVTEYLGNPADFLDISGDQSRPVDKLLPLVPRLPISRDAQPLLALQVTLFPKFGLCVSLAVHHAACDGFSSMQFVKLWSATAASSFRLEESIPQLPEPPAMDRTAIPDPRNLYLQMEKATLDVRVNEKKITSGISGGVYAATFTFSAPAISRLKKELQKKAEEQGMPCFHCSSFVVSCAYSWICLLKTRRKTDGEGKAHFVFAVDWRRRIRPPIPANYFGNCLSGCFVKWDAGELLAKDGILMACKAIGKEIGELGDAHESMDGVMEKLGEIAPWRPLSLAGSPKLGVYGTDFGWGKPAKVEVMSTRETGAIAMAESRDGDGGIEVGVILPEENLRDFANYFGGGMDW